MTLLPYFSNFTATGCAGLGASSAFMGLEGAVLTCCPVAHALHIHIFILLRQCQQLPGASFVTCPEAAKLHFLQRTPAPRPCRQEPLALC